jgi:hypothetical protein
MVHGMKPFILLFYIMQRIIVSKFCIFKIPKHCIALLQVALVSFPPHKFVSPPYGYYRLQESEKYDFGVKPNGITCTPNFIQIGPGVPELNHADRQTWPALYAFISYTPCKERLTRDTLNTGHRYTRTM